jgi:hypothetical protein
LESDAQRHLRAADGGNHPDGIGAGIGTPGSLFMPYVASGADHAARLAEVLAEHDEEILAAYLNGATGLQWGRPRAELAAQTGRALVHPVFFGSALTGAGVDSLMSGIAELLPAVGRDAVGPVAGRVFKIERGAAGEKIAYIRMFSGTARTRDRVRFGGKGARKVTAISVFGGGPAVGRETVSAGDIGKLWGLAEIRVGDAVGTLGAEAEQPQFAPPTLETVVVPRQPGGTGPLRAALAQLAEQDPLINLRQDDVRQEIYRLALRRGPEGGDRGDAGRRLRRRGQLPRDDDDLRRAARRHRGGRGADAWAGEPVPGDDRVPHRASPRRLRSGTPARGGAGVDATGVFQSN